MSCPMCGDPRRQPSWLGSTQFAGRSFEYLQCDGCKSLYCDPMPDSATLSLMYGSNYNVGGARHQMDDPRDPGRVVAWLRRQPNGTFLDFGCGSGDLLRAAQTAGWRSMGVEFDPEVAATVQKETGVRVATSLECELVGVADVVNVGDVVEHLTDPVTQMQDVLRALKPGGILLAQGPLEANSNLFTLAVQVGRMLRPRRSSMPPYHVTLATARGQRAFFQRIGLQQLEFEVTEVDWPAPSRLGVSDVTRPRQAALFTLRKLSTALGTWGVPDWGNRYFFAGRLVSALRG